MDFQNGIAQRFESAVAADLRAVASRTIDVGAILRGLLPFGRVGDRVGSDRLPNATVFSAMMVRPSGNRI